MQKKILIVAAHPDDEVLGCGGTICRHVKNGDRVFVLILGEGVTSRRATRDPERDSRAIEALRAATRKACSRIGVKKVFAASFPDNRFDAVALLDIVKAIEKVKAETNPDVVYTHYEKDINVDHQRTFAATMVAFRPLPPARPLAIYSFEASSSTEYSPSRSQFAPNVFVEIQPFMDRKLAALACYKQELRSYPHPRSPEAVRKNNELWGIKTGQGASEAFILIRDVRPQKSRLK